MTAYSRSHGARDASGTFHWGARRIAFELARKRVDPAPSESAVYRCLVRAAVIDPTTRRRVVFDNDRLNLGGLQFYFGLAAGFVRDREVKLAVGYMAMDNRSRHLFWNETRTAELGTEEFSRAGSELASGLLNNLKPTLGRLTEVLNDRLSK
jgi:hypothetical protein